jgi:hypothetical protein
MSIRFEQEPEEPEENKLVFWRPPTPLFVPANTTFRVARAETDFYVARLSLYKATEMPVTIIENSLDGKNGFASVPEPTPTILLALGLLGIAVVKKKE